MSETKATKSAVDTENTGKRGRAAGKEKSTRTGRRSEKKSAAAKRRRKGTGVWYMVKNGRSMSLTFFKRNGWLIVLAMVAIIWLISQRYSNQSRMEEIRGLEKTLRRAESRKLDAKADYMSLIRESRMRELMERNNLTISYQEQPPYILPSE